jgi:hypothetical protein
MNNGSRSFVFPEKISKNCSLFTFYKVYYLQPIRQHLFQWPQNGEVGFGSVINRPTGCLGSGLVKNIYGSQNTVENPTIKVCKSELLFYTPSTLHAERQGVIVCGDIFYLSSIIYGIHLGSSVCHPVCRSVIVAER